MAENEEKKENKAPAAEGAVEKKSKKKLFILLGILVLVAGGGGGAAFFLLKGKKSEPHAADAHASADAPADAGAAPDPKNHAAHDEAKPAKKDETANDDKAAHEPAVKDGHADPKKDGAHEQAAPAPSPAPGFGDTYAFKPFHLNLGNPLENRYVRLEISTEYKGGEEQKKEIEARLPQLRDAVISVVQTKTREFILSPTGKDRMRYEITTQLNQLMTKKIENVYITDLIIE